MPRCRQAAAIWYRPAGGEGLDGDGHQVGPDFLRQRLDAFVVKHHLVPLRRQRLQDGENERLHRVRRAVVAQIGAG